ncbi:adenylate kinase-domain-containing protein [Tribonema minus]|uniref:UMP-CMP kinase n=1 Tax=Tribonema minus TaxID=303371 RepID=A0A835YW75_9STRA|nr:adenylate kinase-domain-containing protein [Tribonema minus]
MGLKPNVVFVLGGPGSGKGTQCERLSRELGYVHLSAGELLRQARESGSEEGALLDEYLREGRIVPVELSLGLLRKAMIASGGTRFLIDGFPRNQDNLDGWERIMGKEADVTCVLFLECPESVLEARLLHRGLSSGRSDDNLESARKRFRTYVETTLPVVEHFQSCGLVRRVDGSQDMDTVFANTCAALSDAMEREVMAATRAQIEAATDNDTAAYAAMCCDDATGAGCTGSAAIALKTPADVETWGSKGASANAAGTPFELLNPRMQIMGNVALLSYLRQNGGGDAGREAAVEETRVWLGKGGRWRLKHLHCSAIKSAQP